MSNKPRSAKEIVQKIMRETRVKMDERNKKESEK